MGFITYFVISKVVITKVCDIQVGARFTPRAWIYGLVFTGKILWMVTVFPVPDTHTVAC